VRSRNAAARRLFAFGGTGEAALAEVQALFDALETPKLGGLVGAKLVKTRPTGLPDGPAGLAQRVGGLFVPLSEAALGWRGCHG
jgi:hypothetical protein